VTEYLVHHGRSEEAEPYRKRLVGYYELMEKAAAERSAKSISKNDTFLPHGLSADDLDALRRQLGSYRAQLDRVFLVQKRVEHLPEHPYYVLAFRVRRGWTLTRSEREGVAIVQRMCQEIEFPGEAAVVSLVGQFKPLGKRFEQIRGADIFTA
jgi:hypothetical protein